MPDIKISSLEGTEFGAYCAMPPGGSGPGLIVCQEIFGVNGVMRQVCDDFAVKGYIAVCPDLFWRQQPGVQLTDKSEQEWARAFELFQGFDLDSGLRDLIATLAHVRRMKGCSGRVGSVGFCLGGKLAFLMAARSDVDAAAGYYGVELDKYIDEVPDIRVPTVMHIAALDKFVPPEARAKVLKAFARNPEITAYVYDNADHAFARVGGEHYDKDAAILAHGRTDALFGRYLLT